MNSFSDMTVAFEAFKAGLISGLARAERRALGRQL